MRAMFSALMDGLIPDKEMNNIGHTTIIDEEKFDHLGSGSNGHGRGQQKGKLKSTKSTKMIELSERQR